VAPGSITPCPVEGTSAFDFLADPATMPRWAIHNVSAIRPLGDGRWEMDTPRGRAVLAPRYDAATGILDHR
jgi:hypothetical protein